MPTLSKHSPPNRVAALIALGLVYYLTAQVGFELGSVGAVGTLVWPPTGIAVGASSRSSPPRRWAKGSRFRIYLPALAERVDERRSSGPALLRGNGEHVLFVDDEQALVSLGRRTLQRLNYRVTGTTRPEEALAMVRANPADFDLVITDLTMPVLTGTVLAAAIQRVRADLPVILATGYGGAIATHPPGICALLQKPATLEQFATEVYRVLRSRTGEGGGATPA